MSYFVLCTFDITDSSPSDYVTMYADLEQLGLRKKIKAATGAVVEMPTTTVVGTFGGSSTSATRDTFLKAIEDIYERNSLHGKYFVDVGDDYAWGYRAP